MLFTRNQLHFRHQLSHQQIDDLLNERRSADFAESKAAGLYKLKLFLDVTKLLHSQGIQFISLKGPVLSYKLYNDPTYRTIGDFDFLLDPAEIGNAVSVLTGNGFILNDWPESEKLIEKKKKHRNQVLLEHSGTGALVELHWRLLSLPPVNENLIDLCVKNNLAEVVFERQKFVVLNAELELLFLIIHGGQHNWFRLKWLEDVHQIALKNNFDRVKFKELVILFKAERMTNLCNSLLEHFYPGDPAFQLFGKTPKFAVNFSISRIHAQIDRPFETLRELMNYSRFVFSSFPGLKYKIKVIRFILFSIQEENNQNSSHSFFIKLFLQPLKLMKHRYGLQK